MIDPWTEDHFSQDPMPVKKKPKEVQKCNDCEGNDFYCELELGHAGPHQATVTHRWRW